MNRWFQAVIGFIGFGLMLAPSQSLAQEPPSGPLVTLNLSDVEIRQFLRLAHDITGANIVVAPEVRGRVTALMQDVAWNEAFDAILKANGLVAVQEGHVLRIVTVEEARRELVQRKEMEQARETAAPVHVCTYHMDHADASEIAELLRPFLSPRGQIVADGRTNTLIVSDVPQVLTTLGIMPVPASRGHCVPEIADGTSR